MAFDGVVGSMQGADAPLLAESVGGIPRGLCPDHTVEDDPGAGFMNTVTKYMVSGEITTSSSSTLVRSLLDLKRLDGLNLLIYRVIVGRGKRLAEGDGGSSGTAKIHRLRQWGHPPDLPACLLSDLAFEPARLRLLAEP